MFGVGLNGAAKRDLTPHDQRDALTVHSDGGDDAGGNIATACIWTVRATAEQRR